MGQQDLRRNRAQQQRNQTTLLHGRSRSGGGRCGGGSACGNGGRFSVCSSWFDVRVLYARVACCAVEEAPELLTIWFPPRGIDIALEVNGGRVAPSEEACIALRRDRLDLESEEVTFVSTDNLRTSGSLAFEIYHRHDFLVSGSLKQSVISSHDSSSFCEGGMPGIRKLGWRMECSCEAGSSKCSFVRVQQHHLRSPPPPPSSSSSSSSSSSLTTLMEVCVVGRYIGSPVILTQTVQLNARRSRLRCTVLDVIPEDEECCGAATPTPKNRCFGSGGGGGGGVPRDCFVTDQQQQQLGGNFPEAAEVSVSAVKSRDGDDGVDRDDDDDEEFRKLYESDYEENGDVSWFNAGVRVGVGIGLGVCLGVGLGVGLMVRTYNATARSFRRGLL